MAGHTFKGKRELCYTEVTDFTDFQGIGRDPLYKRYDSVFSVIKRVVPLKYQHFLATPQYNEDYDQICWYIDEWNETPVKLTELTGESNEIYNRIKKDTIRAYQIAAQDATGEELMILAGALKYKNDDCIYCSDGKVYLVAWGMTPDVRRHKANGSIIHDLEYVKKYTLTFDAGEHGQLKSRLDKSMTRNEGTVLSLKDIPEVSADEGWIFESWTPSPLGFTVVSNQQFTASYHKAELVEPNPQESHILQDQPQTKKRRMFTCHFDAGKHGHLEGFGIVQKEEGSFLNNAEIPFVQANDGYEFIGWNLTPSNMLIDNDKFFTAQYRRVNWYHRWWLWLKSMQNRHVLWKWLWRFLLTILGVLLLVFFLRSCDGCRQNSENGVVPLDSVKAKNGRVVDDNGCIRPITGDDGKLPDARDIVAPVMDEEGEILPIVRQPGVPNTIANRLFLFMEDDKDNVDALAQDFKRVYNDDKYSIIGYDKEVKLLVVQIPENERDQIRQTINSKIPNHKFIVFDEEIYELNGCASASEANTGWHLNAIHLKEGWRITKGSPQVKVAVVDDGIEAGHPMFKGRITDAYNVFTQSNTLSIGEGHGTHTAGLAVGSADFYEKGASGVAPNCRIMPIQVFDNKQCPLSALIAGTMYAIHHGADVVNLSVGPSFRGLNQLPVDQQTEIARQQFKNVERLWARVCSIAAKKNCILVFAAGNDDILSSIPPENRNEASIVVAAVDKNLYPTDFTNYGPCSDISAPGKSICSSFPHSSFKSMDGTSMAAPIVTGTIALMKSLKRDLTVIQARNVLYKTGADVYGFIPPMVLVDKVLAGVKRGDFNTPSKREMKPVPEGKGDESAANRATLRIENPVSNISSPPQQKGKETDYDAIRRKIAEYKKKISELEKLLP